MTLDIEIAESGQPVGVFDQEFRVSAPFRQLENFRQSPALLI